ncbi:hypothetical protein J2Z47_005711 [Cohnella thailandensis]|jgi:hypothetical protein|nr:hypothetical protein [Cohnella thailandensis]
MLIHDYDAYTIWKIREAKLERKNELERMLRTEEGLQPKRSARRKYGIQQFLSLLTRKLS